MFHIIFFIFVVLLLLWIIFQKDSEEMILPIIIGVIIYYWIPNTIDYFLVNNINTENQIIEFWSDYGGTIIGPIITLFGVWWQVTRQEKQKERDEKLGLLKILHHYLKKVVLDKNFEKIKYHLLSVLSFTNSSTYIREDIRAIPTFEDMSFKENDLKIMGLDYGEDLLEINTRTISFNKEWVYLIKTSKEREELVEKIKTIDNIIVKELMEVLENLSNIIFYYTCFESNDENLSEINRYKNILLNKNNFSTLKTYDNKDFMKLFDEKECVFDRQTEKTMIFLSELLVAEVWLLYSSIPWERVISKEEKQVLYNYYVSISKIASINVLKLLNTIKKTDKKIMKDLEKLEKLSENKKRKICLKRLQRVKKRSPKLYNIIKFYIKKRLVWTKLIKNIKLYIDKLLYKC